MRETAVEREAGKEKERKAEDAEWVEGKRRIGNENGVEKGRVELKGRGEGR